MRKIPILTLALLAFLAAPLTMAAAPKVASKSAPRAAPKAVPQPSDWTTRVTISPIGGYVMGNPAATTKVVEYLSYTCPHCAHFSQEADAVLKKGWVRDGRASIEIRNATRDAFDITAAVLARCGGPGKYFGNHAALFDNYENWMEQQRNYDDVAPTMQGKSQVAVMIAMADKSGLFALMQKRGFTRPQLVTCMGDKKALSWVLGMTEDAWNKVMIEGTPSFSVNGQLLKDVHDWDGLKPALPPGAS